MKRYVRSTTKFHRYRFCDYKSEGGYVIEVHHGGSYGNYCDVYDPNGNKIDRTYSVKSAKQLVEQLENGGVG